MKKIIVFIALLFIATTGSSVQAAGPGNLSVQELSQAGQYFKETIIGLQEAYSDVTQVNQALKEAGASYQKRLTADPDHLSSYATAGGQAAMSGIFAFDAGYAALFLQKKDAVRFMEARRSLGEKAGLAMPFSPAMKQLLKDPDAIRDFDAWSDALEETQAAALANGLGSDMEVKLLTDFFYGMVVEGLYITCESAALSGYPPGMLSLMDSQRQRVAFMIKVLNLLRGDDAFEEDLDFSGRMYLLKDAYALLTVAEFTPNTVDRLRELINAERETIMQARDILEMAAPAAE